MQIDLAPKKIKRQRESKERERDGQTDLWIDKTNLLRPTLKNKNKNKI